MGRNTGRRKGGGGKPPDPEARERAEREAKQRAEREAQEAAERALREEEETRAAVEAQRISERQQVEEWAEALKAQRAKRLEQRAECSAVEDGGRPSDAALRKLDSNVKKNSGLVKKLRSNLFQSQRASILSDIEKLNLTKYIPETVASLAAIAELNKADTVTAVEAACMLHCRYKDFTAPLRTAVTSKLGETVSSGDHKSTRILLRFYTELTVAGIFGENEISRVVQAFERLTSQDLGQLKLLALVVSFCKFCGTDVAGLISRKQRTMAAEHGVTLEWEPLFNDDITQRFRKAFNTYYEAVSEQLLKDHKAWQKIKSKNEVSLQIKGEVTPEKQEEMETLGKAYDALLSSASTLADALDVDLPELPDAPEVDTVMSRMNIDISNPFKDIEDSGGDLGLWEDAETREFYESVTDLRAHVPEMLFRVKEDIPKEEDESAEPDAEPTDAADAGDANTAGEATGDDAAAEAEEPEDWEEDEDEDEATMPATDENWEDGLAPTDPLMVLLEALPNCVNRADIDKAAIDFCHLNNKGNRKRLALSLFSVKKARTDLLPFYARLVAILHPGVPDIAEDLLGHLLGEFRFHMRKKIQDGAEARTKNIRFIGELTKFRVIPPKHALDCLEKLLRTFKHHDIDVACALLVCTGRFLFRTADTHVRTRLLLDIMQKKRGQLYDERQQSLIDNAILYCDPPEHTAKKRKVRPPLHEYLRHLIYNDTSLATTEPTLRKLKKFPWADPEFFEYAVKCFVRVWLVNFGSVRKFTAVLAGLVARNDRLGMRVVDAVLEEVYLGMEHPRLDHNQRRICTVRYLAEMFNYRLVNADVIRTTLYSLLLPHRGFDPPTNYFRCKLVCTILDSCGHLFKSGAQGASLDTFLTHFQLYFLSKAEPLPFDTEIAVYDTLETLRPKLKLFNTRDEAAEAVAELQRAAAAVAAEAQAKGTGAQPPAAAGGATAGDDPGEPAESEEEEEMEDGSDSEESGDDDEAAAAGQGAEAEPAPEEATEGAAAAETAEDESLVFTGAHEEFEYDPDDEKFVEDFEKMMSDTLQARRNDVATSSIQKLDVSIPVHLKGAEPRLIRDDERAEGHEKVVMTLLTRAGLKNRELVVPVESGLADRMLQRQQVEEQARRENKRFVMSYEQRVQESELRALEAAEGHGRRGRGRGRRVLFSNSGRGRARGSGFVLGHAFETELLKDMGYDKDRPKGDYRGGDAVYREE
eukprot:m.13918 g.13918  ORF g.13918 m.13918 type:complete len:1211 (+) comp4727_c0_seq1:107-3739(+)